MSRNKRTEFTSAGFVNMKKKANIFSKNIFSKTIMISKFTVNMARAYRNKSVGLL